MKKTLNAKYYLAASVAFITFFVYLPVLQNAFVQRDDGPYIFANTHIRSFDAAFFKWAFLDFHESNWHPLTWISHALDYALWGLTPLGHHLTSIVLHAINTFLVVFLVVRILEAWQAGAGEDEPSPFPNGRRILIAAGTTGLLFGLHPLHVESVAWAAERKDLLCALFFLLSVLTYTQYAVSRETGAGANGCSPVPSGHAVRKDFFTNRQYLLALGFFVLALLSKPMAVSLPLVLLILDWHPFDRIRSLETLRCVLVEKLPFLALSLGSSIVTVLAQRAGGAMALMSAVPLPKRVLVAAKSLNVYLGKMMWPLDLVPFYPYPKDISFWNREYIAAVVSLIGITAVCIILAKKRKWWLAAWGYYVVTLVPVLGIVQVGGQAMADRYTYLPSVGPFLLVGAAVAGVLRKAEMPAPRDRIAKAAFILVVLFVFISLSWLTFKQIGIWKNDLDLWNHVIKKEPEPNPLAYSSRGMLFFDRGLFDEAIADFTVIINQDPSSYPAYLYRGMAFYNRGRLDQAIDDYNKAIILHPSSVNAYMNRGMALGDKGLLEKAIEDYGRVIALDPSNNAAYNNMGALYGKAGMSVKAIEAFTRAIATGPDRAESYFNRGLAYASQGQYGKALEDLSRTIELNRNDAAAHLSRGRLRLITGKTGLAAEDFQKACELGNSEGCSALQRPAR